MDIEQIESHLKLLKAQVEANERLLLRHAHRHSAGTAADPLALTSTTHTRLHTLQNALDHSGVISATQHGTQASGNLHPEYSAGMTAAQHTAIGDSSPHHVRYADSEARAAVPFIMDIPFGFESQTFYP